MNSNLPHDKVESTPPGDSSYKENYYAASNALVGEASHTFNRPAINLEKQLTEQLVASHILPDLKLSGQSNWHDSSDRNSVLGTSVGDPTRDDATRLAAIIGETGTIYGGKDQKFESRLDFGFALGDGKLSGLIDQVNKDLISGDSPYRLTEFEYKEPAVYEENAGSKGQQPNPITVMNPRAALILVDSTTGKAVDQEKLALDPERKGYLTPLESAAPNI